MPTSQENDLQIRFLLPQAGVRGVSVRLEQTWQDILAHADYPDTVRELLGQSCAAAALFTGHAKVNGRLSLQLRSQHALRTLFAECTAQDTLRGIARMADGATNISHDLRQLGEDALLAITIENPGLDPRAPPRCQRRASLQPATLSAACAGYCPPAGHLPPRPPLPAVTDDGGRGSSPAWSRCWRSSPSSASRSVARNCCSRRTTA